MRQLLTRLYCALALLCALSAPALAIDVTIAAASFEGYQYGGPTATVKLYASQTFTASDSSIVGGGTQPGSATGFYKSLSCTVAGTTLSCPGVTLKSTTDALVGADTVYTAVLFDSRGTRRDFFPVPSFWLSHTNGASTTWAVISQYNGAAPRPPSPGYYTTQQTDSVVAAQTAPDATYVTQTPHERLTGEQALSALQTGLLYNTTGTGVLAVRANGANGECLIMSGGVPTWSACGGGGGGGGVTSVFGRAGDVVAQANDYAWAQLDKSTSSLADINVRSASDLNTGFLPAARMPALTGDVTSTVGTVATTITEQTSSFWAGKVTDETGSGAWVFAASPSVTSPTVGTSATFSFLTQGSVPFAGAGGALSQDNASLFFDDANNRLGVGTASPTQKLEVAGGAVFINNPTATLYLKDASTGFQSASNLVVTPLNNNSVRSTSYTSGLLGWNVSAAGDAEFNNLRARGEIASSVFKVSEIAATAGTFGVFYSAAALSADAATPSSTGVGFSFTAKNSDAGGMLFAVGNRVRFKSWTGAGVSDSWASVTARTNNGTTTTYTATLQSGTTSATYRAGTAVVDYGPSGTGFITLSADGTVGASPNLTMATHAGSPWSAATTLLRAGNLNGSYGYTSNTYGFGIGQYGASSQTWLTADTTSGIRIGNNTTQLAQWDASGSITVGQTGAGQSNVHISSGAVNLRNSTTNVITLSTAGFVTIGQTGATNPNVFITSTGLNLRVGSTVRTNLESDGSGWLANSSIAWDTAGNLTVSGNATIAGWTVQSAYFAKDTGTNATSAGMAPADFPFFAGGTYANRATAPFRVTPAGALTASNANVTGTVTATAGAIGGWTLATSSLTSGAGATRVGLDSGGSNPAFYAGSATPGSAPFRVTNAGALTATNATITGAITATSGSFTGSITSTSGTIGGWTIGSTSLTSGSGATTVGLDSGGSNPAFYAGSSTPGSAPFRVTNAGALTATNATLAGSLSAASGAVTVDSNGLTANVTTGAGLTTATSLKWRESGTDAAIIYGEKASATNSGLYGYALAPTTTGNASVNLWSQNSSGSQVSNFKLVTEAGTPRNYATFNSSAGTFTGVSIGSGAAPATSAILDLSTTTGALLFPRLTTAQRDALTAADGMVIYNTTAGKFQARAAGAWVDLH